MVEPEAFPKKEIKLRKVNPYTPGAGKVPQCMGGRNEIVDSVLDMFENMKMGMYGQSILIVGIKGMGKTVLLKSLYSLVTEKGIYCAHVDCNRTGNFNEQINFLFKKFLLRHSDDKTTKNSFLNAVDSLKCFQYSYCSMEREIHISDQKKFLLEANGFSQALTDLFCSVGAMAKEAKSPICLFADDLQNINEDLKKALFSALQRTGQLEYPIVIIASILPGYHNILFPQTGFHLLQNSDYIIPFRQMEIERLTDEQVRQIIVETTKNYLIYYENAAIEEIINITNGCPAFVQELCHTIYDQIDKKIITKDDVKKVEDVYDLRLENSLYNKKFHKCSKDERRFIFAMTRLGEDECTVHDLCKYMHKSLRIASEIEKTLVGKGIVYSGQNHNLNYVVPGFGDYIRGLEEYNNYCFEKKL